MVPQWTIHSQQSKQQMLKKKNQLKPKEPKIGNKNCLQDSFIETIKQLQHGENDKQPTTTSKESLQSN